MALDLTAPFQMHMLSSVERVWEWIFEKDVEAVVADCNDNSTYLQKNERIHEKPRLDSNTVPPLTPEFVAEKHLTATISGYEWW
jgi:hypothetical protein